MKQSVGTTTAKTNILHCSTASDQAFFFCCSHIKQADSSVVVPKPRATLVFFPQRRLNTRQELSTASFLWQHTHFFLPSPLSAQPHFLSALRTRRKNVAAGGRRTGGWFLLLLLWNKIYYKKITINKKKNRETSRRKNVKESFRKRLH